MEDYKEDIRNSRRGSLGSSDGKLILQVCERGEVPKSAYKRLAVLKGFIEQQEIPQTAAVRAGDELEMLVYDHLKSTDDRYQSNPLWVSTKFSRKNVKLISHPDIVLQDDEKKVLNVYEVKCTKYDFRATRQTYKAQLLIHWYIANEVAKELGGYKVRLFLVHYNTEGLDLEKGLVFETDRLTVKQMSGMVKEERTFPLALGMDIIDNFLETFDFYCPDDEIDSELLPANVKEQFNRVTNLLAEIKEREDAVASFKEKLYEFLLAKNIKGIKSPEWSISRVDATESTSFDAKKFLEEYSKEHPRLASQLKKKYSKVTKKKGYCSIKLKSK